MSDPRALIKAATPGKWEWNDPGVLLHPEFGGYVAEPETPNQEADTALIVYAINNLPTLLDVAEALERLLGPFDKEPDGSGDENQWWWNHPEWSDDEPMLIGTTVGDLRAAYEALARLKESR